MQMFDGEDLNNKARMKFQGEQLREWAEQQKREKDQADLNQKKADRLYELKMKELDHRAMELAKAEDDCRRAINEATTDYNSALVSIWNHTIVIALVCPQQCCDLHALLYVSTHYTHLQSLA